jgi:hypothetical protein
MTEIIEEIRSYEEGEDWCKEAGFQVVTNEQVITLAIDDFASCCEEWGYFLTEDDTDKFVGSGSFAGCHFGSRDIWPSA